MKKVFSNFKNRQERAAFIAKHFAAAVKESNSILDVGCSENDLKRIVGNKVFGIDIAGTPDKKVDLEKEKLSAFPDNSFDLAVCTEVLEHVDNFYEMIHELKRVSKKYILISLPNCSHFLKTAKILFTGNTGKFYGLPANKPEDRHKWFFSWEEADKLFTAYCQNNNLKINEKFLNFNTTGNITSKILGYLIKLFPLNSLANDYWILIEK